MVELLTKWFVPDRDNVKDVKVRERYGSLSGFVGIAVNLLLSVMKLVIGLIVHSVAITADAFNNLSDAGSSIMSLISFRIAAKPADRDHPFGHARIEYIASLIVSFLILLVGVELFSDSFMTLIGKKEVENTAINLISLIILCASILMKFWLAFFYRTIGNKIDSSVIRASATDSLSDCISTSAVLLCSFIIKLVPSLHWLDAAVGLAVSLLIFYAGIQILKETMNTLLGEGPVEETVCAIREIVARHPDAQGIHDLMVHNYGPGKFIASLHVEVDGSKDVFLLHDEIDNMEREIYHELGILCTIHMDPIVTNDETVAAMKQVAEDAIKHVDAQMTLHDFRTVVGQTHTNLIFDIVVPFENTEDSDVLVQKIQDAVSEKHPNYFCVITVDRG